MHRRRKVEVAVDLPDAQEQEPQWWDHPPKDMEGMLHILSTHAPFLSEPTPEGVALRALFKIVETSYDATHEEIRAQYPLAYFKPSYEQSLLLNCWIWGIDFPVCFAANRIGKTACFVINGCLYIFPNNPDWEMFASRLAPNPADEGKTFIENPNYEGRFYLDLFDRPVQTLQRPPIVELDLIRFTLKMNPELMGDPTKSHLEPENEEKFARLQELCPSAFNPAWPAPPLQESGAIWLGAPDNSFHAEVTMPEWKRWLPAAAISHWSNTELSFTLRTDEVTNPCPTVFSLICKSYESEDTKWSGSAVYGIILTEGLSTSVLNEVKQRIKANGFGSWDYTPYEARNIGGKTALAFKVFKGEEQLPLRSHIFTRFSARQAPAHILPTSKKDDLIRMWAGKKEGDARLDGIFYSSSPLILSRLDRPFHCLNWTVEEMFDRYPSGQVYRGFDPGYDHPSVCAWGYLIPGNIWIFYRYYVERQKTIKERCQDIVSMSGNKLKKQKYGSGPQDYNLLEIHPNPNSEVVVLTAADYHLFKMDEVSGLPYSLNYIKAGLVVTESHHMSPENRAIDLDDKLDRSTYHTHPDTKRSPGSRIFFLTNGVGVDAALCKMESLFWDRLAGGANKGMPKDKVPSHGDDELDATCYLACAPYVWTNYSPRRINNWEDDEDLSQVAALQGTGDWAR